MLLPGGGGALKAKVLNRAGKAPRGEVGGPGGGSPGKFFKIYVSADMLRVTVLPCH